MEGDHLEEDSQHKTKEGGIREPLFDVATVSDMCVDLILHGNVRPQFGQHEQIIDSYGLELGGSANIFASQMAKLGMRAAVIGYVGCDLFGDFALQRLTESGVDTSLLRRSPSIPTGLGVHLSEPDDRAILTVVGTIDATQAADLPASPQTVCRHWHLASPFLLRNLSSSWPQFLARARAAGVTVSLDPNWDTAQAWNMISDLLPWLDVLLPNEAEAIALTGMSDAVEAGFRLAKSGALVVVKRGAAGAIAVSRGQIFRVAAAPIPTADGAPIDTVGAGDNFDAGFLRAWMAGKSIEDCLSLGSLCAAASLACAGGIEGQLTRPIRM